MAVLGLPCKPENRQSRKGRSPNFPNDSVYDLLRIHRHADRAGSSNQYRLNSATVVSF
jgi:hypothetical protein